jgi:putative ABC transport system permease protein
MFTTYFTSAWRNLLRNKVYSGLNILGLATGMAVALLIGLWVYDQTGYDKFLPAYQQAYQVRFRYSNNGMTRSETHVCIPLAAALKKDIPEIEHTTVKFGPVDAIFTVGEKKLNFHGLLTGDEYLQVFKFPVISGNAADALKDPSSVVITESTAMALFGVTDVVGRVVDIYGEKSHVTAVLKDVPRASTMQFSFIRPLITNVGGGDWVSAAVTRWGDCFFDLYVSFRPGVTYAEVEPKFRMMVKKYSPESWSAFHREVTMQPMADWHLYTDFKDGYPSGGLIDYIRLFSIIGILVLLIACINFMNLSTARSEKRAREVGIRKVIGSSRRGLIGQFLIESIVIALISGILALAIVQLVLPGFNTLIGTGIAIPYGRAIFWLVFIAYVGGTGLLAGSRPAFYLSSFKPIKVLKGVVRTGPSATRARKTLVVLQFTCSIALIIGTVIVYQQIQFARSRPRGYDPSRLLSTAAISNYPVLKREVLATGMVSAMTRSTVAATSFASHNTIDGWPGSMPNEALNMAMMFVADSDYFKTLGIAFVAGRNFTGNLGVDSPDVILNESAVHRMRLKQPLGQSIHWSSFNSPNRLRVVGVVKDVVTDNPFGSPEPEMFVFQPDATFSLMFRLDPKVNTHVALSRLQPIFHRYNRDGSFDYKFIDDSYAELFSLETLIGQLAGVFAILAIFISCLGLFGLAAYVAEQRTREIGIRKVLGATVAQVLLLLSKEFIVLVGISCLIASPLAWYFSHQWLQGYDYRITPGAGVFLLTGLAAIVITALTVGYQSVKAALMNPVKSLRAD